MNNIVYITEANFIKVIGKKTGKENPYKNKLYEFLPFGYLQFLTHYKNGIEELSKGNFQQYVGLIEENRKMNGWIFTGGGKPAYHKKENCDRLNSSYENYQIPIIILNRLRKEYSNVSSYEIEKKWEEKQNSFREWFFENKELFDNDKDSFYIKMQEEWGVNKFDDISHYDNSGINEFTDGTGVQIEKKINTLIKDRREFIFNECSINEKKIIGFLGNSFYLFNNKGISIDGDYKDDSERVFWEIIDKFHENYRGYKQDLNMLHNYGFIQMFKLLSKYDKLMNTIKHLLILYINIKGNKDLSFDKSILDGLGFQKCNECFDAE